MCLCSCTPCEGIHAQVTSQGGGGCHKLTVLWHFVGRLARLLRPSKSKECKIQGTFLGRTVSFDVVSSCRLLYPSS